jgi:hypothetical protein
MLTELVIVADHYLGVEKGDSNADLSLYSLQTTILASNVDLSLYLLQIAILVDYRLLC